MYRLILLGLLAGCTTQIVTQPDARIYVDGEYVGTGYAELRRVGPPNSAEVRVEQGGRQTTRTIEREFRASTVLFGLVSAYTGLYWGWSYPDEVRIDLPADAVNPWLPKQPVSDPWGAPPGT